MADDRIQRGILGDIDPRPTGRRPKARTEERSIDHVEGTVEESMEGGSRHDRAQHAGSREVTEGVTGGVGTETGGTRNYRSGTGATGGDIGNRPE